MSARTIFRGTFFLSKPQRAAWEQARAIAHEGRSEHEADALLTRAALLAAEQLLALKSAQEIREGKACG